MINSLLDWHTLERPPEATPHFFFEPQIPMVVTPLVCSLTMQQIHVTHILLRKTMCNISMCNKAM